jgi:integrase
MRHLVKKGRPGGKVLWYWQPSPSLRRLGFADRRLSDEPAEAEREAQILNDEADRYRVAAARGQRGPAPGTVAALVATYLGHDDFLLLGEATQRGYRQSLEILRETIGDARLQAITPPVVQALKNKHRATPWKANALIRVLRLLWSFARREGAVSGDNPAGKFRELRTRPRRQLWTREQEAIFLAAASPEMRAAFILAVSTGQREGDLLSLPWSAWDGRAITLRQRKTGVAVSVPATTALAAELGEIKRRATVILTRPDGRPWKVDHFRHVFAETRENAGIKELQFRDLRRTAVVRLAEAGCTLFEVSAVTGHSVATCQNIIEDYFVATGPTAAAAIVKLEAVGNGGRNKSEAARIAPVRHCK